MKRIVQYSTADGQTFPTRALALRHETNATRMRMIAEGLQKLLELSGPFPRAPLTDIVALISAHPEEFRRLISARNARAVANLPGSKRRQR